MQGSNRKNNDMSGSTPAGISSPAPLNQNGLASARILNLLGQIGDRLIQSEQERIAVREALGDLENRAEQTERIFLTIQDKISKNDSHSTSLIARQEKLEQLFIESAERLQRAEALTEKIEEAIALQNRLARRLEKSAQDKARILNRIEHIELGVEKTREALSSKALIQLAEQVAAHGWLPTAPAANDLLNAEIAAAASWWKRPFRAQVPFVLSLLAAGVLGGVALSQIIVHWPQQDSQKISVVAENITPALDTTTIPTPNRAIGTSTDETDLAPYGDDAQQNAVDMDAVAAEMNAIEPGRGVAEDQVQESLSDSVPAKAEAVAPATELSVKKKADNLSDSEVESFVKSQIDRTVPLASRIQADPALPTVIKAVEQKAFQGVPEAQHDLAAIYTAGHAGVTIDYNRAAAWFSEAAANGVANARYNLGVLYHQGLGVERDVDKAIGWYRAAAVLGHPEAQYNLGIAYIEGIGTKYNPRIAADYFEKAARGGVLEAAYNLGLIYENGLLGDPDMNEAVFWYALSADHSPEARVALTQTVKALNLNDSDVARIVKEYSAIYKIGTPAQKEAPQAVEAPQKTGSVNPITVAPLTPDDQATPYDPATLAKSIPQLTKEETQNLLGSVHKDQAMIKQVQEQLIRLGLFSGPADGLGGSETEAAIRAYQKQNNLSVTGKPSEDLLVRMLASEINSAANL